MMTTINKFAAAMEEAQCGSAREFFRELIRQKMLKNNPSSYIWTSRNLEPSRMLYNSFTWADTMQGGAYWRAIYLKLADKEEQERNQQH